MNFLLVIQIVTSGITSVIKHAKIGTNTEVNIDNRNTFYLFLYNSNDFNLKI